MDSQKINKTNIITLTCACIVLIANLSLLIWQIKTKKEIVTALMAQEKNMTNLMLANKTYPELFQEARGNHSFNDTIVYCGPSRTDKVALELSPNNIATWWNKYENAAKKEGPTTYKYEVFDNFITLINEKTNKLHHILEITEIANTAPFKVTGLEGTTRLYTDWCPN